MNALDKDELTELLTTGYRSMDWDIAERIQKTDKATILSSFEEIPETIRDNGGVDKYVCKLMHNGNFEATKTPFHSLVNGYGYDERFFQSAPVSLLQDWIVEFAEFLGKQREKLEKLPAPDGKFSQFIDMLSVGLN